jgi:hypothetical protein
MVALKGGTLPVGSDFAGRVVGDFQIGKYEVTWGEWRALREWAVGHVYSDLANVGADNGDNYPVTAVSWYDVVKWCNARSEMEGKTPVYQVSGATYKTGQSAPDIASGKTIGVKPPCLSRRRLVRTMQVYLHGPLPYFPAATGTTA